jgi:uncharacterized protein (TIGR02391 family)
MSLKIFDFLPDQTALLDLEPEELAGVVLEFFNTVGVNLDDLNRYNFGLYHIVDGYPDEYKKAISEALMEAWMWLEREVLIAPKPQGGGNSYFITRKGHELKTRSDLVAYRNSNLLPKDLLHPLLVNKIWASFLRGEYDTSVFIAFREVEEAVRKSGGFKDSDFGVTLMRNAFRLNTGPLTDSKSPQAEQEALMHLFDGAIGFYKNPSSHRTTSIHAVEAIEMIIFASHLIKIAEFRKNE